MPDDGAAAHVRAASEGIGDPVAGKESDNRRDDTYAREDSNHPQSQAHGNVALNDESSQNDEAARGRQGHRRRLGQRQGHAARGKPRKSPRQRRARLHVAQDQTHRQQEGHEG